MCSECEDRQKTINQLIRDNYRRLESLDVMTASLTRAQAEGTALIEENRKLRGIIEEHDCRRYTSEAITVHDMGQ